MKECKKCKQSKPLADFYKAKYTWELDGHDYYCKYCRIGTAIKSHKGGNKKTCSVDGCLKSHYAKTWCRMHYARFIRNGQLEPRISPKGSEETRDYMLRIKYLITLDEFNERSKNGCEICGDKPERSLHVDHDHKCCHGVNTCGECVRGIICNGCNRAVAQYETGVMRADYSDLDKIKAYLEKYNG